MLIEWKEEYSVNVKEIDEQHKNLVKIINDLYNEINSVDVNNLKIEEIFDNLVNYAKIHFATEEGYFDKFGYPDAEHHKSIHRLFGQKILSYKEQYKKDKIKVSFDLVDYLEDWFLNHLAMEDKKYTKFFNEHGLY